MCERVSGVSRRVITHQRCAVTAGTDTCTGTITPTGYTGYGYDDNDNRTTVTESSTAGSGSATTRTYCYNALNRLTAEKLTTACASSPDETYVYDDAGNRTSATVSGSTRTFTYGADGQLDSCSTPSCTVSYDASGRSATVTDNGVSWTFAYDADGKLISACKSTACAGSIDRVDYLYDGSGHRIQIKETTSAGVVTTTDLRYQGEAVVQELVGGTVSRTYATDDTGRIVEVCDPDCATGTVYVVVYNGHGDATGLWKQEASGALTLANSYTYSTWGTPTTTVNTGAGFSDLKYRFLYVGASDVQWDASFGLNLHYMHARHYSPALGRFVQPDPSGAEANLYGYAQDSPVSQIDPSGLDTLDQLGRMNFYEWLLCITHPRQCADWHDISSYAFRVGPAVGRGGDARDAIRHCTWQCLLAKVMGPGNAAMWAIAHEARWEGASTIMDMHNNAVGRSLARYVPWHYTVLAGKGYSVSTRWVNFPDAYRLCGQALRAGDLWVLDHGRAVPFER